MSTTQNLLLLHSFKVKPRESAESLFARFNDVVRALETKEYPMVTTKQITAFYIYHLEELVRAKEAEDLVRRVKEEERFKEWYDEATLIKMEVHKMALGSNRAEVVYETKLRSLRLQVRAKAKDGSSHPAMTKGVPTIKVAEKEAKLGRRHAFVTTVGCADTSRDFALL